MSHDTRDSIVDFVRYWSDLAEIATRRFISWIGISTNKFYERKAVDYAASTESTTYPVMV